MNYQDRVSLEQVYQTILEGEMPPTGQVDRQSPEQREKRLKNKFLDKGMQILNMYAKGEIDHSQAADLFQELDMHEGEGEDGPTQDDQYYTTLKP